MITREQIPTVLDHPVYDADGNKIGEAKHVFLDDVTGQPEWGSVKTGLFGTSKSFVPGVAQEVLRHEVVRGRHRCPSSARGGRQAPADGELGRDARDVGADLLRQTRKPGWNAVPGGAT
jgi:hypothetical protein